MATSVASSVAPAPGPSKAMQFQALVLATGAFTVCFAVWTLFSIAGIEIKQELNLHDSEFGLLVATPVLTGALSRLFLGLLSDRFGGRKVLTLLMLLTAGAVYAVSLVSHYPLFLLGALGLGFAGGAFAVGISYVSSWFDRARQGMALGVFGAGTVGTAVTTFAAPSASGAISEPFTRVAPRSRSVPTVRRPRRLSRQSRRCCA